MGILALVCCLFAIGWLQDRATYLELRRALFKPIVIALNHCNRLADPIFHLHAPAYVGGLLANRVSQRSADSCAQVRDTQAFCGYRGRANTQFRDLLSPKWLIRRKRHDDVWYPRPQGSGSRAGATM